MAQKSAANCLHNDLKRTYIGKKRRGAKERCAFFIGAAACREYVEFYLYSNFTPACKIFSFIRSLNKIRIQLINAGCDLPDVIIMGTRITQIGRINTDLNR